MYEFENLDLFNELNDLIGELSSKYDIYDDEFNADLRRYIDLVDSIESGNISEREYSQIDDEDYLKSLIAIAKQELSK